MENTVIQHSLLKFDQNQRRFSSKAAKMASLLLASLCVTLFFHASQIPLVLNCWSCL